MRLPESSVSCRFTSLNERSGARMGVAPFWRISDHTAFAQAVSAAAGANRSCRCDGGFVRGEPGALWLPGPLCAQLSAAVILGHFAER